MCLSSSQIDFTPTTSHIYSFLILPDLTSTLFLGDGNVILKFFGYPINKAIGSAAAIGFIIALFGAIGFLISGNYLNANLPLSIGFLNIPAFLILHVTFSFSLLLHWYNNNNECSLTYMEAKLRGLDRTESFTHKFIAPLYDISRTEWSRICYIVTIVLMFVSIHYLYNSDKVSQAWKCFTDRNSDPEYKNLPLYRRIIFSFNCFKPLLIWC